MTATQNPPGAVPAPSRGRLGLPTKAQRSSPGSVPVRRRWARLAAGAILALLGGWVSVSLYLTAGDRVEVVVVARDVEQYAELTSDDLATVRVAADREVETISGSDLDDLVGQVTAVPLVEGTLLAPDELYPDDEPLVMPDEAEVAFSVPSDRIPESAREQGTAVRLVIHGDGDDDGTTPPEVPAWILRVGEPDEDEASDSVPIEVVISQVSVDDVSLAAEEGRISVVRYGAD